MLTSGQKSFAILEDRGVVSVKGDNARDFLQGLVTNDMNDVAPDRAIWAALLSPQGKYLHDFFITEVGGVFLLDCERARADDLIRRLSLYKLRSKVDIADESESWAVAALIGSDADADALAGSEGRGGTFAGGICYVDPRYGGAGARAILPRTAIDALEQAGFERADASDYDIQRLINGLPDGSRDLAPDKAYLLENGFDLLNGIAWDKGCYVGQELTARMRYRGTAKRRLLPVEIAGAVPAAGTTITITVEGKDRDAGEMRSARVVQGAHSHDGLGLALLRVDALEALSSGAGQMRAGETAITPLRPPYMRAPSDAAGDEAEKPAG